MRMTAVTCLLALCLAPTLVASDKPATVKGEVVDTFCYSAMGAHGDSHVKCGMACAKAGIPVGLVEGKKMYILLPPKDGESLPAAVVDHMGKVVTVTGNVYTTGGNTFLTVQSVK